VSTLILRMASRVLVPVMAVFSVYLLLRGHNAVGGGFIGALVAGAAVVLDDLAAGPDHIRRNKLLRPDLLVGGGLLLGVVFGLGGLLLGDAFLAGTKIELGLPNGGVEVAASLVFDLAVYAVVVGVVVAAVTALEESAP
jgi:multicomponent Na+:H+ antiporter subunit B